MLSDLPWFAIAFAIAIVLTPVIRGVANRRRWLDRNDERRARRHPIPRLGGIAIASGVLGTSAAVLLARRMAGEGGNDVDLAIAALVGGLLFAILGVIDDLFEQRARTKLAGQVLIALVMAVLGLTIREIAMPWGTLDLGIFAIPVSVVWIVAIVNAVNLIDGLDGLAPGVGVIAVAALYVLALNAGQAATSLLLATTAGALLAFLVFNSHPATIIMGDSGSLFVGSILASASITVIGAAGEGVPFVVAILILAVPILDTLTTIVRRAVVRVPVFRADQQHIHHRLLATGLSHRRTVLVLYALGAAFGGLALAYAYGDALVRLVVGAGVVLLVAAVFVVVMRSRPQSAPPARGDAPPDLPATRA